ncbi:MAG: TIGR03663 family protein [Dehalococcoidia bacterium]|nr:MAG: TIGR03663 family protein [Dehalococcoidia bacterium]
MALEEEEQQTYSGTTAERLRQFALSEDAKERLSGLMTRYWEITAYAFLVATAAVLRFYNLGARAMHHDESLHGFFSYGFKKALGQIVTGQIPAHDTYKHVPFMHGPFQFIGPGFVMFIFQDGEFQSRMLAAGMGTAMVFMPFLLRKQLGTAGALATAFFIAFSPTLLYYSRFIREDIYTAFWTLGIVIFMWRYMATRQNRFLFLTAGFLAGSFMTKETTFMTAAAFIIFMDFLFAVHIADKIRATSPDMSDAMYALLVVILIPAALFIAILWPFIADWRSRYELDEMPPEADLIVVMGTVSLPMYAAGMQLFHIGPIGFGPEWRNRAGNNGDSHIASQETTAAVLSVFALIGIAATIGLAWRPKVWAIAAACFWVPAFLLSTTFFTNLPGFFSVVWGSMDYWISQQDVRRGNQPDYYYFITIPVYEFLPLILSIAAALYYAIRGRMSYAIAIATGIVAIFVLLWLPPGPKIEKVSSLHIVLPFVMVLVGIFVFPMDRLNRFLLYWAVITAFALTVAGEKMPWLNVHIALPLAVVAGRFVGQMIEGTDLREDLPPIERVAPFLYSAAASGLAILVFVLLGPFTLASAGGWILVAVAAISVYWAKTGYSTRTAFQVALIGFVAAAGVFTVRASVLASWGHPDDPYISKLAPRDYGETPDELLVYTQTSGDIPVLADKIGQYARDSRKGKGLLIVVDSSEGYTWPWAWYLRDYKNVQYQAIGPNYSPPKGAIVLVHKNNAGNVQPGPDYGPPVNYAHRRWFPEDYRGADQKYSTHDFFRDLFSKRELSYWLDFWVRRTPPNEIGSTDGVAFFPKDFSAIPTEPVGPTVRTDGTQLVIGGDGSAPGQLNGPAGVKLDKAGNIYVADTNNNRIQKYDPDGNYLAAAGGFTSDFSMNQPWSMAVADDGTVFVADTWNHKIIKLDKDLKKVKEWGVGGQESADGDPTKLFGPRDITLTAGGNVVITDTGNSRIIEYTKDGDFVRQLGGKVSDTDAGPFKEPVGLAAAPNGDLYVADFWNKRIVHLDKDWKVVSEIKVPTWGSNGVTDRPYLALLPDGRLLATDPNPCATAPDCPSPQSGKILVFDAAGNLLTSYEPAKEGKNVIERPIGIASDGTSVLVADSAGSVVRKIPLTEITK